jgi:hypothetical protein
MALKVMTDLFRSQYIIRVGLPVSIARPALGLQPLFEAILLCVEGTKAVADNLIFRGVLA